MSHWLLCTILATFTLKGKPGTGIVLVRRLPNEAPVALRAGGVACAGPALLFE